MRVSPHYRVQLTKTEVSCCRCRHVFGMKACRRHSRTASFPYLFFSRSYTYFIFPSRFPPAFDSQRWVHAFAFMDTLQQSWAPTREEAPQWLGHPRPINEAGEAEVAVTFHVKEEERESPEAARAGRHWTERPPAATVRSRTLHGAQQTSSAWRAPCRWCWDVQYPTFPPSVSLFSAFTHKQHSHSCKELLLQPGLPDSQQSCDGASILAASQGGEIAF